MSAPLSAMGRVPRHVAIIMDGNGRWAEQRGELRTYGHLQAVAAVEETIAGCMEQGISYLTLYAFSIENWQRPEQEVATLMDLLSSTLKDGIGRLLEHGIRLRCIGDLKRLPASTSALLHEAQEATSAGARLQLCLAINYSGRWEIAEACRSAAYAVQRGELQPSAIDEACLRSFLQTADIPDPELLIRTGGEQRISNFLLWQLAYTELYFVDVMWPEFRKTHLLDAVRCYERRERRFGKISAQLRS